MLILARSLSNCNAVLYTATGNRHSIPGVRYIGKNIFSKDCPIDSESTIQSLLNLKGSWKVIADGVSKELTFPVTSVAELKSELEIANTVIQDSDIMDNAVILYCFDPDDAEPTIYEAIYDAQKPSVPM